MMGPKNKEEAKNHTYWRYSNKPDYDESKCAAVAADTNNSRYAIYYQCTRKPGHGPDKAFCKMHGDMIAPEKTFTIWSVSGYRFKEIKEYSQATKTTEKSVWIKGNRQSRHSDYEIFFDKKEEAVAYLVRYYEAKIKTAESDIEEAEEALKNLKQP